MKKTNLWIQKTIILLCLTFLMPLQGCNSKGSTPYVPKSEDCNIGNLTPFYVYGNKDNIWALAQNRAIMRSDSGFYYNALYSLTNTPLSMHYVDASTGKDILLCNKPECKHDGNEYCAATNAKYVPLAFQFYDDSVYVSAISHDSDKFSVKLLRITPDGASLSEIATVYDTFADGIKSTPTRQGLLIHRNLAILSFSYHKEDMPKDTWAYGTAILNLNTKEVTYADPDPIDAQNLPWMNVSARGDYVYYVTKDQNNKHLLHRMKISDLSTETFDLESRFGGDYAVLSDDEIIYTRKSGALLCKFHPSDGTKLEITPKTTLAFANPYETDSNGEFAGTKTYEEVQTEPIAYHVTSLFSDGTYVYLQDYPHVSSDNETGYVDDVYCVLHVVNADLEEIHTVVIPNPESLIGREMTEELSHYASFTSFHFIGDETYFAYSIATEYHLYSCGKEEFLQGHPKFQHVFDQVR